MVIRHNVRVKFREMIYNFIRLDNKNINRERENVSDRVTCSVVCQQSFQSDALLTLVS